jgi:hypothetical protein
MNTREERKKELYTRLEQLDTLLGKHIEPHPADAPQIVGEAQLQYVADRREEREFILKELDELNKAS